MVTSCTKPCHTLYQTLSHLVPDPGKPCTRPWSTLYQTLEHLLPDPASTPRAGGWAKPSPMRVQPDKAGPNFEYIPTKLILKVWNWMQGKVIFIHQHVAQHWKWQTKNPVNFKHRFDTEVWKNWYYHNCHHTISYYFCW